MSNIEVFKLELQKEIMNHSGLVNIEDNCCVVGVDNLRNHLIKFIDEVYDKIIIKSEKVKE